MRSYLNFGSGQRVRFYPEFITSFLPKLFVASSTMNQWKALRKLYADPFKKGWTVNLEDTEFNAVYKAMTGYDLETNNYRREKAQNVVEDDERRFGALQYIEQRLGEQHLNAFQQLLSYTQDQGFDSDAVFDDLMPELYRSLKMGYFVAEHDSNIAESVRGGMGRRGWMALKETLFRWKKIECKEEHPLRLTDCRLVERLIRNLKSFREHQFQVDASNVFEFSLSEVVQGFDHLLSVHRAFIGDKLNEIRNHIAEHIVCSAGSECVVLEKHSQRKRENEGQRAMERVVAPDAIETLCEALSDNLCAAHCYLLHRNDDDLYRLSSGSEGADSRFSTMVQVEERTEAEKEKKEPLSIDFGVSVLKWLKIEEEPHFGSLREEIVENEESTIDEQLYDQYQLQCLEKLDGEHSDYTLDELMGLKLFTDTTKYQGLLRKAHWTITKVAVVASITYIFFVKLAWLHYKRGFQHKVLTGFCSCSFAFLSNPSHHPYSSLSSSLLGL